MQEDNMSHDPLPCEIACSIPAAEKPGIEHGCPTAIRGALENLSY